MSSKRVWRNHLTGAALSIPTVGLAARLMGIEATAALSPLFCPFHAITGWVCPTCGLGRSLVAGASLAFSESFRLHPLGLSILVGVIALTILSWVRIDALIVAKTRVLTIAIKHSSLTTSIVFVYIGFGILRNHL